MVKPNVCCHIPNCFLVLIETSDAWPAIVVGVLVAVMIVVVAVVVAVVVGKKLKHKYGKYKVKQYKVTHSPGLYCF